MYALYVGTVHNIVNHLYYEEVLEQQPVLYVNNVYNKQLIHGFLSNSSCCACVCTVGTVHNSVNHLYCEEMVEQQPVLYVNNNNNVNTYVLCKKLIPHSTKL